MKKDSPKSYDVLGNIAIVKFPKGMKKQDKIKFSRELMKRGNSIKTILEKEGKIHGRLRKIKTRYVFGEKTKEVIYRENGCVFRFNIDTTYFSPRLSNERKEIANKVKKDETVLVMFAGVGPYSIVIAKNSKAKIVFSNEINREANKYAKLNIELNNLKKKVELIPGDIKKSVKELKDKKIDVIVMPRPKLKETFLKEAFSLSKKGTRIYYYDFCDSEKTSEVIEKIKAYGKKSRKKIKILGKKAAGEIAPGKIRLRVDFKVL